MPPNGEMSKFHALLIGIDAYPNRPLRGCVPDIDDVEVVLRDRLKVPRESIRKLVAPQPTAKRKPSPNEQSPTKARIIAELKALASAPLEEGHRVFIYYSGHGTMTLISGAESYFEGLVPLDSAQAGDLYDIELNPLLQAIANKTKDLTVILDCCNSAGTTRGVLDQAAGAQARFAPPSSVPSAIPGLSPAARGSAVRGLRTNLHEDYVVIAACHANESAQEIYCPELGIHHGALTSCLLELLGKTQTEALTQLRWADIWERLRAAVQRASATQYPEQLGPLARGVFGGPWKQQDCGLPVTRNQQGDYIIGAGQLAGLGSKAQVAVYDPIEPAFFPPSGSAADPKRLGTLEVVELLDLGTAKAQPLAGQAAFALPDGARGRLVKPGEPNLLRVSLQRNVNATIYDTLKQHQHSGKFVILSEENDPHAEVHVGQYADGRLWIGDDVFGAGPPIEPEAPGPLGVVPLDTLDRMALGLYAGLNHYAQYVIPLRLARSGGFGDLRSCLSVKLVDCSDPARTASLEEDASLRREMRYERGRYLLPQNDNNKVCIVVHNAADIDLYVSLLDCNTEGKIEFLDTGVAIARQSGKVFWSSGVKTNPFEFWLPDGLSWGIDRLVTIATNQRGVDLKPMQQNQTLSAAIVEAMTARNAGRRPRNHGGASWAAVQTLIEIGTPTQ